MTVSPFIQSIVDLEVFRSMQKHTVCLTPGSRLMVFLAPKFKTLPSVLCNKFSPGAPFLPPRQAKNYMYVHEAISKYMKAYINIFADEGTM